jgi:hypothetical protein
MDEFILEMGQDYVVHVHADDADGIHALNEAKKGEKLVDQYTCEWITPTPQRGKSTFTSI